MKWFFHKDIDGTHLLFESFQLADGWNLFAAYTSQQTNWKQVILRTLFYGFVTVLRLWYMLTTMYFNTGLFIVVVVALTSAQFMIEVVKSHDTTKHTEYRHSQYETTDKRATSYDLDRQDTALMLEHTSFPPNPQSLDTNNTQH